MKKPIRQKNKNSASKTQPDKLLKASTRKGCQKKVPKKNRKNIQVSSFPKLEPIQSQTEELMKN